MQKLIDRLPNSVRWILVVVLPLLYVWLAITFRIGIWGYTTHSIFLVILGVILPPYIFGKTGYYFAPKHRVAIAMLLTILWGTLVVVCSIGSAVVAANILSMLNQDLSIFYSLEWLFCYFLIVLSSLICLYVCFAIRQMDKNILLEKTNVSPPQQIGS